MSSPKKRPSITAALINSVDHHAVDSTTVSDATASSTTLPTTISHQQSVDLPTSNLKTAYLTPSEISSEADDIKAEPLEKILEHKLIREKREALEKKLKSLRKTHEKDKLKLSSQRSGDVTDGATSSKKSKFYMSTKLVKRLSSKNM